VTKSTIFAPWWQRTQPFAGINISRIRGTPEQKVFLFLVKEEQNPSLLGGGDTASDLVNNPCVAGIQECRIFQRKIGKIWTNGGISDVITFI
jgi:hypothetical protein